jgi:hypothetical protein
LVKSIESSESFLRVGSAKDRVPGAFPLVLVGVLHANAQEVTESDLGDVVRDVLVVLEVSAVDLGIAGNNTEIRL